MVEERLEKLQDYLNLLLNDVDRKFSTPFLRFLGVGDFNDENENGEDSNPISPPSSSSSSVHSPQSNQDGMTEFSFVHRSTR